MSGKFVIARPNLSFPDTLITCFSVVVTIYIGRSALVSHIYVRFLKKYPHFITPRDPFYNQQHRYAPPAGLQDKERG